MDYQEILAHIAPCGLNCRKCLAHVDGEIRHLSEKLSDLLGPNFGPYAERLAMFNPVFENYSAFRKLLDYFASGSCRSCRTGDCVFFACPVKDCVKEKGVDFCFQCKGFPCQDPGLSERLRDRWKRNNEEMQRLGVKEFFRKVRGLPRYP